MIRQLRTVYGTPGAYGGTIIASDRAQQKERAKELLELVMCSAGLISAYSLVLYLTATASINW
jgi:hypothetical protein